MKQREYIRLLKEQVRLALGCTEPVAVALAVASAAQFLSGPVYEIVAQISPNIYKNGLRVGIPGTDQHGLEMAAALGAVCGGADAGLEILRHVNEGHTTSAKELRDTGHVQVLVEDGKGDFYIEAEVTDRFGHKAGCIIEGCHTNIISLFLDGQAMTPRQKIQGDALNGEDLLGRLKQSHISDICRFAEQVDFPEISFMLDGVRVNMEMAEYGLNHKIGMSVGQGIRNMVRQGVLQDDVVNRVKMVTAAACDARMAGVSLPVMSSAGSGNHGLTAILPVAVVCDQLHKSDEDLARALAISHLVTSYIKEYTGKLSPICGCAVAAGIGASAAITWLYGGSDQQIVGAIQNMVGTVAGMLCDGAKGGCALKLAAAASEAVMQANFAANDIIIGDTDGIVGSCAERTIQNLGKICTNGMRDMDREIIGIMCKATRGR